MTLRNILVLGAVVMLATACSQQKSGHLSLSVANAKASQATAPVAATAASAANQLDAAGIDVTALHVAVREFELDDGTCPGPATSTGPASDARPVSARDLDDDEDDAEDECESEIGPIFVSLDQGQLDDLLAGGMPVAVKSAHLEAGVYTELEVKVRPFTERDYAKLGPAGEEAKAVLRDASGDSSIVVELYVKAAGRAVTCRFSPRFEFERHVRVEVTEDGSMPNLTLALYIESLFKGIDSVSATDDPCSLIAANLADFLDVYEDDDHDGKCDHHDTCDHGGRCDHD